MSRLLILLVPLCCGAGCAPRPAEPVVEPSPPLAFTRAGADSGLPPGLVPRQGAGDLVLARVGGAEIRRSDVGEFTIRYFREQAGEALTHLIDERIIAAEAGAAGIEVEPRLVASSVDEELGKRENRIRVEYGADVSLADYLLERYGTTVATHRKDLERLVRIRLLRDRVIRFGQGAAERIELRDAVFANQAAARRASDAARKGADLGRLAEDAGVRPQVALPPVTMDGISPPDLAAVLFALGTGEVTDPVKVTEDGRALYHVFKLVRRLPATERTWAEEREAVLAGLRERPVETAEYLDWTRRMRDRYEVEMLR